MTPARWAQIKEIFSAARAQPEPKRAAWLDAACGDDDPLRAEVERLLAQDGESLPSPAARLLAQAAPALVAGEMLSHYRVEAKLGEGGMGTVYRAYDTQLHRRVALKVLAPAYFADPKYKQGLLREARAASALSHPNIVAIYEIGSGGVDFIAMEFVEGHSLSEVIPSKGLPLEKALGYAIQIASGLAKAHAAGVIHRDLKPGNIMLTPEGRVKLLDFGLALRLHLEQQESTQTLERGISGTPAYMSPEQAQGKDMDARSDLFSFGLVLYQMLTGRPAFSGDSAAEIMAAVLREAPPPLKTDIPRELQKIVARCLRKDPARRFQHADDVTVELEELKRESDSGELQASALPVRPRRRWPWISAISAGATAGVLLAATWLSARPDIDVTRLRYTPVITAMYQRAIEEGGGEGANTPAWSPDGNSIVYSADGVRIQRVDGFESSPLTTRGLHPFFSADGSRVYYLTSGQTSRELWSVSVAGGEPQLEMAGLGGPGPLMSGAAMSRDGRSLVVVKPRKAGEEEMSVWVSTPPGASPVPYPGSPVGRLLSRAWFHFSPDGSKLLLTLAGADRPVEWWLLKWPPPATVQPGAVRRLFENGPRGGLGFTGDWLLDSRHLVVSVPQEGEHGGPLSIADTQTGTWRPLTPGPIAHLTPRVSRDGRVLFAVSKSEENAVEIPLDGSAIRPLLAGFRQERYPSWSSMQEEILFVTNERGEPEIWLASVKQGRKRPIVTQRDFPPGPGKHQFVSPAFSPDGTRIAYASNLAIWVSPVAGGPPVRICDGWSATWSPDGAWLAVATDPRGVNELIKVPLGHPQDAAVIHRAAGFWLPRRSPSGKWITIQFPEGFGVISPDGGRSKVLHKGRLDFGAACGWSRDGSTLYLAYLTPKGRILSAFDLARGTERQVRDLGRLNFSYFAPDTTELSASPDGGSLAASVWNVRFEPWILDGLEPPRRFWRRLLRPW
jgi:Tol biopolymer transport system component